MQLGRDRSREPAEGEARRRRRGGRSAYARHYGVWERWYLANPEYTLRPAQPIDRLAGDLEARRYVRWLWGHRAEASS